MENRPKVLLTGNGFNLLFGKDRWDKLLKKISIKEIPSDILSKIPYPLQAVVRTGDTIGDKMKEIAKEYLDFEPTEEEKNLIKLYGELPFDAILTTNYTYELEKTLIPNFKCNLRTRSKFRKFKKNDTDEDSRAQLHSCFPVPGKNTEIWHIHGEAAKPDTMIIGHNYYGKLIAKAHQHIAASIRCYKSKRVKMEYNSWVDYFILGDIYILGFGMDLSELDIWWLISFKKREFPDTKIFFMKPDIKPEEKLLAETYGIEVVKCDEIYNEMFMSFYQRGPQQLKYLITNNKENKQ